MCSLRNCLSRSNVMDSDLLLESPGSKICFKIHNLLHCKFPIIHKIPNWKISATGNTVESPTESDQLQKISTRSINNT